MLNKPIRVLRSILANCCPPQRNQQLLMKWTYRMLDLTFWMIWISPLRWDRGSRSMVYISRQKLPMGWLARRLVTGAIVGLLTLAACSNLYSFLYLELDDVAACHHLITIIIFSVIASLATNIFCHPDTLAVMFNSTLNAFETFNASYYRRRRTVWIEDVISGTTVIAGQLLILVTPLFYSFVYMVRCDISLVGFMTPFCKDSYSSSVRFYMGLVQHIVNIIFAQVLALFVSIWIPALVVVHRLVIELACSPEESLVKLKFQTGECFTRFYICIYRLNSLAGLIVRNLLAFNLAQNGAWVVILCFYQIRGQIHPFYRILFLGLLMVGLTNYVVVAIVGGEIGTNYQVLKDAGKNITKHQPRTKYFRACQRALPPMKLHLAHFAILTRHTPISLFYRIVDVLVTTLCATK